MLKYREFRSYAISTRLFPITDATVNCPFLIQYTVSMYKLNINYSAN